MNNDIKNIVRTCNLCEQYYTWQQRETFIPHEIPDMPWTKVGTGLFEIYSKSYLIVVDYASSIHPQYYSTWNEYFPDMVSPKQLYPTMVKNS